MSLITEDLDENIPECEYRVVRRPSTSDNEYVYTIENVAFDDGEPYFSYGSVELQPSSDLPSLVDKLEKIMRAFDFPVLDKDEFILNEDIDFKSLIENIRQAGL